MTSAVPRHGPCKKQECFLCCLAIVTWLPGLKGQVEGFRCVRRRRGRPGDTEATGDSKHQLGIIHAHKWLLSRSTGLFGLKRRWYIIYDIVVSNCLCMVDGIPMLISWVLTKSTEHSTNSSKQYLYKKQQQQQW